MSTAMTRPSPDGRRSHPLYRRYRTMIARCENPNRTCYPNYGGRGISVCPTWRADFWAFVRDVGEPPAPTSTLDRIDNDGDYEPGNVRWATPSEQMHGQRKTVLSESVVRSLRSEYSGGRGEMARLARSHGVSTAVVYNVLTGLSWKDVL